MMLMITNIRKSHVMLKVFNNTNKTLLLSEKLIHRKGLRNVMTCNSNSCISSRMHVLKSNTNINLNRGFLQSRQTQSSTKNRPNKTIPADEAQRRAYDHYRKSHRNNKSNDERSIKIASYAFAVVIGALGATYAAVPLYKIFCQATGFGGTTQRVTLSEWAEKQDRREESGDSRISQALWDKLIDMSNVPREMLPKSKGSFSHGRGAKTWTDEEAAAKLASLKPIKDNGRLITVRFDSTIGDVMPWSFIPAQLDVKVVPGETALSFFTATNHSDKAITGVATYNVHPPRAGLYFNKIQCFCFEEQRLLPGETVDMPVFFFIDPEYADDPQLRRVNNITLSYTFFQTDEDDEEEDEENVEKEKRIS